MILRIFIAIMALNASHASATLVERDTLITRRANTTDAETKHTSWSLWSVMSSACHVFTHITPEEILREKLKGLVFPDGRDAAGNLVRSYTLPPSAEIVVDQNDMLRVVSLAGDEMSRTDSPDKYSASLKIIVAFASRGNKHALSTLAWLFASGNNSVYKTRWLYVNEERAALFREAAEGSLRGNKSQEEVSDVLRKLLEQSRGSGLPYNHEEKKGR